MAQQQTQQTQQKDKAVLAYSGGLDTSVCIKWLQEEKNLDVIAVVGDVGQEHEGLETVSYTHLPARPSSSSTAARPWWTSSCVPT